MAEPPLRVMLVDDHEVVRGGIKALLQATDDIVVTAEAGSVQEAIDKGRVVETGTHAALVRHKGLYARLAKAQDLDHLPDAAPETSPEIGA